MWLTWRHYVRNSRSPCLHTHVLCASYNTIVQTGGSCCGLVDTQLHHDTMNLIVFNTLLAIIKPHLSPCLTLQSLLGCFLISRIPFTSYSSSHLLLTHSRFLDHCWTSSLPGKAFSRRSTPHGLVQMSNDQHWNRNDWTQVTQGDYLPIEHYHYAVPDGYAPVNGYVPVQSEAQNGYLDYQISTAGSYGTHPAQEDNNYAVEDDDTPNEEVREFVSPRKQKRKSKSQAMPKEEQTKSKRAQRREKIALDGLEVSAAKDEPKGLVELREGVFR